MIKEARFVLGLTLFVMLCVFAGCAARRGTVEFQHAQSYAKPVVHGRGRAGTPTPRYWGAPLYWENPRVLSRPKFEFPDWLNATSPVGLVLRLYVDEEGNPAQVEIIGKELDGTDQTGGERLLRETMELVKRMRFECLIDEGEPRNYSTVVSLTFRPKTSK